MTTIKTCGYTVTDVDGIEGPCDGPATGWRWYQNVGIHEDALDVACDLHQNEGGRRIAVAEARLDRVSVEADWLNAHHDGSLVTSDYPMMARRLRAILGAEVNP